MTHAVADGAAQVGHRAQRIGPQPSRAAQVERQHQAADFAFGRGNVIGAHCLEVHALQAFAVRYGQHRVLHRGFVLGAGLGVAWLCHGFGDAAAAGWGAILLLFFLCLEQRHGDGLFGGGGVAPEQSERLVEHVLVLVAMDHRGAQGGARFGSVAEINERQRLLRGEGLRGANGQAGTAQQPREVHDVGREGGGREGWGREGGGWRGHRDGGEERGRGVDARGASRRHRQRFNTRYKTARCLDCPLRIIDGHHRVRRDFVIRYGLQVIAIGQEPPR